MKRDHDQMTPPAPGPTLVASPDNDAKTATASAGSEAPPPPKRTKAQPTSTALLLRNTQRELGYLPPPRHYSMGNWTKRTEDCVMEKWRALEIMVEQAVEKQLNQIQTQEAAFERAGPPDQWGYVASRAGMAHKLQVLLQRMLVKTEQLTLDLTRRLDQQMNPPPPTGLATNPAPKGGGWYPVLELPDEIWMKLCQHLDPPHLAALGCVCRRLNTLVRDPVLWRGKLRRHFDDYAGRELKTLPAHYSLEWESHESREGIPQQLPLRHMALWQLFGPTERKRPGSTGIWRELYLRLWYTAHSKRCGLCRVNDQNALGRNAWEYSDTRPRLFTTGPGRSLVPTGEKEDLLVPLSYGHDRVVERACDQCINVMLLDADSIRRTRLLAPDPTQTYAKIKALRSLHCDYRSGMQPRYFIEDVLVMALKYNAANMPDPSPHIVLPTVDAKPTWGASDPRGQSQSPWPCAWEQAVRYESGRGSVKIPTQNGVRWWPRGITMPKPTAPEPSEFARSVPEAWRQLMSQLQDPTIVNAPVISLVPGGDTQVWDPVRRPEAEP